MKYEGSRLGIGLFSRFHPLFLSVVCQWGRPVALPATQFFGAPTTLPELSVADFAKLRQIIYAHFGIHLTDRKRELLVSRLYEILQRRGFRSFEQYVNYLTLDQSGQALSELANRISTHHTFFFRESRHLDFLTRTLLPELIPQLRRSTPDLRVWCAGCASGEEAYSLAMLILEFLGAEAANWNAGVLATDIASHVLNIAREGVYPIERIEAVPPILRMRYFKAAGRQHVRISEHVKKEVTFRRFNLMNTRFPFKKPFHAIFCRNVMIYFDVETRNALVRRLFDVTAPGGYLFIGHSESLEREKCPYTYVAPAIYRKIESKDEV